MWESVKEKEQLREEKNLRLKEKEQLREEKKLLIEKEKLLRKEKRQLEEPLAKKPKIGMLTMSGSITTFCELMIKV